MQDPQISVILATYNNENTIGRSLSSVLLQQDSKFEVIVINDASTDGTSRIIGKFAAHDSRIRIINLMVNRGRAQARNAGIAKSNAPYIAIMDGDDISLPSRLKLEYEFLQTHPDIAWVSSWGYSIDTAGKLLNRIESPTSPDKIFRMLQCGRMPFIHASSMIRRNAIIEYEGYWEPSAPDPATGGNEDIDLAQRLTNRYRIAALPQYLYAFVEAPQYARKARYRRQFWRMLHDLKNFDWSSIDPRSFLQIMWYFLQGYIPLTNLIASRIIRVKKPHQTQLYLLEYESWLKQLEGFERNVLSKTMAVTPQLN